MAAHIRMDKLSQDLFEDLRVTRRANSAVLNQTSAELRTARVLSRALRRQTTRREKRRIAHLICLNLITMLRQRPGG